MERGERKEKSQEGGAEMTRHITDKMEVPARHFPWRLVAVLLVLAVIGGSVGSYFAFNKATPTATIPVPPAQPIPVPPVNSTQASVLLKEGVYMGKDGHFIGVFEVNNFPEEQVIINIKKTNTLVEDKFLIYKVVEGGYNPVASRGAFEKLDPTPLPEIKLEWKTNGPAEAEVITGVVINDDKGEIIYAVGLLPGQLFRYDVWKSENGGSSWKYVGRHLNPEIGFKNEKEIDAEERLVIPQPAGVSEDSTLKRDPNNNDVIWRGIDYTPYTWTFILSFDGGKAWSTLNLPPGWNYYHGNTSLTHKHRFDMISSEGTLKLFLAARKVWQAEISLPR